ncbi:MAG: MFS transporter [SAR202 cluster bacterium]|nr:MFS transporter [SAR202 cluster bacterium]MQG78690.1 MFS transporter [SAR202 cluster bacterium]|tara:strand:- start:1995 stop:3350 length:1356 start_codon:yes stop_codon:yes gene_type:complete
MAKFNLEPSNLVVAGRPVHYAWVIVAVAAVMRLFSSSFRSSSSILIPRLVDSFGWSYGAVGLGFAIQWIVSGMFGPPAGWLGDRYGVRWTMRLGAVLFIVGMVLTGFMRELWQFYLFFGVILSAAMGIFQVPLTAAVTLWFRKHLGTGMGLLQSSQGIGPLVAVPVMLLIIQLFGGGIDGLRAAFWIPGIVGGAVILIMVRFFYNEPAQIGVRALGAPEDEPIKAVQTGEIAKIRTKVFLKQAQRTGAFWNLIGIHFWGCAGHAIILVYLVAMAEDEGVSKGLAAGAFVTLSVTSTITRFAVPVIAERMGSKPAMAGCFFLQVAPIVLLFFAQDAWHFYLFAVLFGIGFGGEMSAFPIINRQYYGSGPIGTTYGYQMMGAGVGMAAGALIGGQLRDFTGNFDATMALSLGLSLVGVISIMLLPTTKKELLPDWEDQLPGDSQPAHVHAGDD